MKIGVVGLGFRLAYIARIFNERVPDVSFVAYADPSPAGLPYMKEHNVPAGQQYDRLEDMLKNEQLDLLMIGSPNHLHLDHIRQGLEAGLKLFSEKPVVTTEEDTMALLELINQHGGDTDRVMVGLVLRYSPLYKDLIADVRSGLLGTITSIEASEHIAPYHGAFFMRDWRRYERYSGSFMLEKCCHDLDLYQGVAGARPLRVASFGGRKTFVPENAANEELAELHSKPSGWNGANSVFSNDGDIIDYQTALIEYNNGASLCFHTNLNVPDEFRRFAVIGSKAMAEGDFIRNFYRVHQAAGRLKLTDKTYKFDGLSVHYGADEQMVDDLWAHLDGGTALPVSVLDALEAGLTALKIDEARKTRSVIDLTTTWEQFDSHGLSKGRAA